MNKQVVAQDGGLRPAHVPVADPATEHDQTLGEQAVDAQGPVKAPRDRGLLLIGIFKLVKSAFFF